MTGWFSPCFDSPLVMDFNLELQEQALSFLMLLLVRVVNYRSKTRKEGEFTCRNFQKRAVHMSQNLQRR